MPINPRRLRSDGGEFAVEWNKINDWFTFLASEYITSDGSILIDASSSGIILRAVRPEVLRYVEATEDIDADDTGEVSKLKFDFSTMQFELMDPEHKFKVRTDVSRVGVSNNQRVVVGQFRDGQWQVIPTGQTLTYGDLMGTMQRMSTGRTATDILNGGLTMDIFDPGQIPATKRLNNGNRITYVKETGLLISFDCDNTTDI